MWPTPLPPKLLVSALVVVVTSSGLSAFGQQTDLEKRVAEHRAEVERSIADARARIEKKKSEMHRRRESRESKEPRAPRSPKNDRVVLVASPERAAPHPTPPEAAAPRIERAAPVVALEPPETAEETATPPEEPRKETAAAARTVEPEVFILGEERQSSFDAAQARFERKREEIRQRIAASEREQAERIEKAEESGDRTSNRRLLTARYGAQIGGAIGTLLAIGIAHFFRARRRRSGASPDDAT